MAVTATPIYPQAVNVGLGTIVPADTTTVKTIFTAGTNGSIIASLIITSTDTSARDVQIFLTRSATNYLLGTVSIPATAGAVDTIPSVNIFENPQFNFGFVWDACGNMVIQLQSGDSLSFAALVTVTTAKQITAVAMGGNF